MIRSLRSKWKFRTVEPLRIKRIDGIKALYGNRLSVRDSLKAQAALELFKKEQGRNA